MKKIIGAVLIAGLVFVTEAAGAAPGKKWPKPDYQTLVDTLETRGLSACLWANDAKWMAPDHGVSGGYEFTRVNFAADRPCGHVDVDPGDGRFEIDAFSSAKLLKKAIKEHTYRGSSGLIAWRWEPLTISLSEDASPDVITRVNQAMKALPGHPKKLYDHR